MPKTAAARSTVLVVDDDEFLLPILSRLLAQEGFAVETAVDGERALVAATERRPDLLILDVGLPVRSGVEVARTLRGRGFDAPMLMLTAHDSVDDRVTGLEAGADDYLPKPFEIREFVARVHALLRHASRSRGAGPLRVRDLAIDPLTQRVERHGKPVALSRREFDLLVLLARHAGTVLSRKTIAQRVWANDQADGSNVVDCYIGYLRRKLGRYPPTHPLIQTVRGKGYVLNE